MYLLSIIFLKPRSISTRHSVRQHNLVPRTGNWPAERYFGQFERDILANLKAEGGYCGTPPKKTASFKSSGGDFSIETTTSEGIFANRQLPQRGFLHTDDILRGGLKKDISIQDAGGGGGGFPLNESFPKILDGKNCKKSPNPFFVI